MERDVICGIEVPYENVDEQPYNLEGRMNENRRLAVSVEENVKWLIGTQRAVRANETEMEHDTGEWVRIIKSVALLARKFGDATLEEMLETAIIWERG